MSWKDIIKSDKARKDAEREFGKKNSAVKAGRIVQNRAKNRGLIDWFNSPFPKEKKKPRKPSYRPRTRGFDSAYKVGQFQRANEYARRKFRGEVPSKPKSQPVRQPTKPTKPKTKIIPRTLIDNYFEMYANQGKGTPTLEDIQREEGRPLTVDEKENYYAKKGEK